MAIPDKNPSLNNLHVVGHEQGVSKRKRILVVEPSGPLMEALFTWYERDPKLFHNCELVEAETTNPHLNAEIVKNPENAIDGVLTGFSLKGKSPEKPDNVYGLELAKLLKHTNKPVVLSWTGSAVPGLLNDATQLNERQRLAREAGVLAIREPDDFSAFKVLSDAIDRQSDIYKA